jgi:hypothetical protein
VFLGCRGDSVSLTADARDESHVLEFGSKPFCRVSFYQHRTIYFHTVLVRIVPALRQALGIRLAFLAGLLLIPAAYCTARILYDRHVALLTVCLASVSSPLILYSTNARGYTIVCLLFLFTLVAAFRLVGTRDKGAWTWLVMLSALGLFTTPVMLFATCLVMVWRALSGWAEHRRNSRPNVLRSRSGDRSHVDRGGVHRRSSLPVQPKFEAALAPYPWTGTGNWFFAIQIKWNMDVSPLVRGFAWRV